MKALIFLKKIFSDPPDPLQTLHTIAIVVKDYNISQNCALGKVIPVITNLNI